MIQIKSAREIDIMAQGGRILAASLELLRAETRPGRSTAELDAIAEEFIRGHDGATPAFKGLYGFPGSICASINNEIVHGIPSKRRVLEDQRRTTRVRVHEGASQHEFRAHEPPPLMTSSEALSPNRFAGTIIRPSGTCTITAVAVSAVIVPSMLPTRIRWPTSKVCLR